MSNTIKSTRTKSENERAVFSPAVSAFKGKLICGFNLTESSLELLVPSCNDIKTNFKKKSDQSDKRLKDVFDTHYLLQL